MSPQSFPLSFQESSSSDLKSKFHSAKSSNITAAKSLSEASLPRPITRESLLVFATFVSVFGFVSVAEKQITLSNKNRAHFIYRIETQWNVCNLSVIGRDKKGKTSGEDFQSLPVWTPSKNTAKPVSSDFQVNPRFFHLFCWMATCVSQVLSPLLIDTVTVMLSLSASAGGEAAMRKPRVCGYPELQAKNNQTSYDVLHSLFLGALSISLIVLDLCYDFRV